MKKLLIEQCGKIPRYVLMLGAILVVGIFLRTYHFHDFLRFNADQSRDAVVASEYLEGASAFPLLGPKAGGTDFRLGNAFYVFEIASAKLFGNAPDRMAYPDLFSSILAIPLLFFFLRKYFDVRTSLLLTAIFSVSFFAVKYSRFAWNPNSLPLWTLLSLYALHEIAIAGEAVKRRWLILAGIAIGVVVQLHTLSLVFFPIIGFGIFGFLLRKKQKMWGAFFLVAFIAGMFNVGQVISEIQTGGANTKAFFSGVGTKEKKGNGFMMNAMKDTVCHADAGVYILSSYDRSDGCDVKSIGSGYAAPIFALGTAFFFGGIILSVRAFLRERELGRKYFLGIFLAYLALSLIVLLPLASEISMRFFLVIVFMPFVFLGLWFDYLAERFPKRGVFFASAVTVFFVLANLNSVRASFVEFSSYLDASDAGMDNVLLREVELSSAFVVAHADGTETVAIDGDAKYLFKAFKSMRYFTERSGVKLVEKGKKTDPAIPVFLVENSKRTEKILSENPGISDSLPMGRFTIFRMR